MHTELHCAFSYSYDIFYLFIYLAAPGLISGTQDHLSSLQLTKSLVASCRIF